MQEPTAVVAEFYKGGIRVRVGTADFKVTHEQARSLGAVLTAMADKKAK